MAIRHYILVRYLDASPHVLEASEERRGLMIHLVSRPLGWR